MYPNFEKFTLMKQTDSIATDSTCNNALLVVSLPMRVQRKRTKGWRMPENTIYVGRGSKWGNPYKVDYHGSREEVIAKFEQMIYANESLQIEIKNKLKGKNLACWC